MAPKFKRFLNSIIREQKKKTEEIRVPLNTIKERAASIKCSLGEGMVMMDVHVVNGWAELTPSLFSYPPLHRHQ